MPPTASRQRPAIRFRQTVLGLPIRDHPVVNKLAQSSTIATVQPALASFDGISSILIPPEWPKNLNEYVDPERDEPILGLHVLSFTDATIVVVCFSHVMMDGGGIESLLTAWSQVLHGKNDFVAPLGGVGKDPLDEIRQRTDPVEPFALSDAKIELASLMPEDGAAPPADPNWDTSSPDSRWRTISLSPQAIASMYKEATDTAPTVDGKKVFVSEDDTVTAWVIRTVASTYPEERPVNTMRLYDMRSRLPVFDRNTAYVQNLYQMAWALFPSAGEMAKAPLGEVAAKLRSALLAQTTEPQVIASMAERDAGNTPLYGSPAGAFFTLNSWVKMKIYQRADFTPAVIDSRGQDKAIPAGQPEFVDFDFALGGAPPGPNMISSGKDARGARHAMLFLSNTMWPKMEAALAGLN